MIPAMVSAITKPPKPVRRAVGAALIPSAQHEAWYALAIATPGLNDVERGVLVAIRDHYRHLKERGYGMTLSYDRLARRLDVDAVHARWAVSRLVELGLVGVERGSGSQANTYLLCLPRRIAKSMSAAAAEDDAPPF